MLFSLILDIVDVFKQVERVPYCGQGIRYTSQVAASNNTCERRKEQERKRDEARKV
jgi:hypothetical protein